MSTATTPTQAPGWYPDSSGGLGQRWHDGQGWTGETSYAKPTKPLGAPFARLSDWLTRLLVLCCASSVVSVFFEGWNYLEPTRMARLQATGEFDVPRMVDLVSAVLQWPIVLTTVVLWLFWQRRLAVAAPVALRRSPGMHVGSWFIPVVALWFPKQNMTDLFRGYDTAGRQPGTAPQPPPLALSAWWGCWCLLWLLPILAFGSASRVVLGTASPETEELLRLTYLLTPLLSVLGAVCAVRVLRNLSWKALHFYAT